MKKILIVLISLLLFFTACNTEPVQPATPIHVTDIKIKDLTFMPNTIAVKAGDKVTWTNMDSMAHRIKGTNFDSGDILKDGTYSFTFGTPGTYEYSCLIHSSMRHGFVVVS